MVSGMQRWCGLEKALWVKQQEHSSGKPPSPGLHSAWELGVSGQWPDLPATSSSPPTFSSFLTPKSQSSNSLRAP